MKMVWQYSGSKSNGPRGRRLMARTCGFKPQTGGSNPLAPSSRYGGVMQTADIAVLEAAALSGASGFESRRRHSNFQVGAFVSPAKKAKAPENNPFQGRSYFYIHHELAPVKGKRRCAALRLLAILTSSAFFFSVKARRLPPFFIWRHLLSQRDIVILARLPERRTTKRRNGMTCPGNCACVTSSWSRRPRLST